MMKRIQAKTLFPEIRRYFDLTEREDHGYSEAEVKAAEKRLGMKLPTVLRKYYRELGKHEMNHTQDFLVPPERLEIDNGHLIFFTENRSLYDIDARRKNTPAVSRSFGILPSPEAPMGYDAGMDGTRKRFKKEMTTNGQEVFIHFYS